MQNLSQRGWGEGVIGEQAFAKTGQLAQQRSGVGGLCESSPHRRGRSGTRDHRENVQGFKARARYLRRGQEECTPWGMAAEGASLQGRHRRPDVKGRVEPPWLRVETGRAK